MDDSPIPEHLIDMLKEAGEIDEDGKPVDDFFDPDEDDTFGTQRERDRIAEEVPYNSKNVITYAPGAPFVGAQTGKASTEMDAERCHRRENPRLDVLYQEVVNRTCTTGKHREQNSVSLLVNHEETCGIA